MRLLSFRSYIFVVALLVVPLAFAQDSPQRDLQAVTVLQQSFVALGGNASLGYVADLTADAELVEHPGSLEQRRPLRVYVKGVDRVRWEVEGPDGTVVSISSAGHGVVIQRDKRRAMPSGSSLTLGTAQFPLLYLASVLLSKTSLEFKDETTVRSRPVYRITVRRQFEADQDTARILAREARSEIYIDKESLLPVRFRIYQSMGDWRVDVPIDLDIQDYRTVQGVNIPFLFRRKWGKTVMDEIRIKTVVLNSGLSDTLFQ